MEDTLIDITEEEKPRNCIDNCFIPCIFSIMALIFIAAIIIFIYGIKRDD
jgi:hypothetical protein